MVSPFLQSTVYNFSEETWQDACARQANANVSLQKKSANVSKRFAKGFGKFRFVLPNVFGLVPAGSGDVQAWSDKSWAPFEKRRNKMRNTKLCFVFFCSCFRFFFCFCFLLSFFVLALRALVFFWMFANGNHATIWSASLMYSILCRPFTPFRVSLLLLTFTSWHAACVSSNSRVLFASS